MTYSGKIIVLAFPDTFVKMSDELMCKILPLVGLGTRTHIKAGHAALVLIENATGKAQYFDFGRYVTPPGKGRVRGANTDVELEIPFHAAVSDDGMLANLDQFLVWLDAHPNKTHGSGRLVASLCETICHKQALTYIQQLQQQGSIPYKAFGKEGSNCARFVTETILASTRESHIIKRLKHNKKFTPSTVGNVEKSASDRLYEVYQGVITPYNSTALRENLTNYFDRSVPNKISAEAPENLLPDGAQLLSGIGSSAWFHLEKDAKSEKAIVRRFTKSGELDFEGIAEFPKAFEFTKEYRFVYDSNCEYCTLEQGGEQFRLVLENRAAANLAQRVHSA
ncbi:MAG: hypothetical protein ACI86L_000956 [Dokdonia sp.]